MKCRYCTDGFTLLELLVVVLIIGILVAIALPQYQKAVHKSRFSSLMPVAQAIRDGQEVYFLTNGQYASNLKDLDVTLTNNEETMVTLSQHDDYKYAKATKDSIKAKNNLIVYQKHSPNFPGEVHCEAKVGDAQAEWLCSHALHAGQELGAVVTPGFNTYIWEGTGAGTSIKAGVLVTAGTKIQLIKAVKNVLKMGLKDSKTFVETACPSGPTSCVIGGNLSKEQQQELLNAIIAVGGTAELNIGTVESE